MGGPASGGAARGGRHPIAREPAPIPFFANRPSYPWWVVGTVCIGAFMGQLDASIAQLVLPTLEGAFHARLRLVGWVSLAYLLALAGTLPIFGRLADMVGRKLLYTCGFALFITESALCGFAPTLFFLIGARVLQALGAGLLQANSVAIVTAAAGPARRGRALGVQGAAQAIGLSAGPTVGGLLIQSLGWQWVFWINVPAGLVGVVLAWLVLPQTKGLRRAQAFDWPGALLLAPALTALVLAISEGRIWGLASPALIVCVVGGVILMALFVRRECRSPSALVDLRLFSARAFTAGNLAGLLSFCTLFGVFFLLPFALERGRRDSPLMAGLILTAIPVALGVMAPLSGGLSDRIGARPLTVGGMLLATGALIALALSIRDVTLVPLVLALLVFGVGQGLFTAPNTSSIMGAAPAERLGVAGGLFNVTRSLGTSLGVALATTVLSWRLSVRAGHRESTTLAPPHLMLGGIHDTLLLFAALALVSALVAFVRDDAHRR